MDFQKLMKTAAANQQVAQKRVRATSLNLLFFEFISQKILPVTGNVSSDCSSQREDQEGWPPE